MPIQEIATKREWKPDQVLHPLLEKPREDAFQFPSPIRKVAVIGAGSAGLPTAKLLKEEGLEVKIFERNYAAGGTWIYESQPPLKPRFPTELPTSGVSVSLPPAGTSLPYTEHISLNTPEGQSELLRHRPPSPCYQSLRNNVATPLIQYKDFEWPKDTPWFTSHDVICQYLQDYAAHFHLDEITEYGASLERLEELPRRQGWNVLTKHLEIEEKDGQSYAKITWREEVVGQKFDAVVIATGHYHVPYIPSLPGIVEWNQRYPGSIIHSKQYRTPQGFGGKNVLVIGNGTSAMDISRDISRYTGDLYQSVRESEHQYDEKYKALREEFAKLMPKKTQRVGAVKEIRFSKESPKDPRKAVIKFQDGKSITGVDQIIICTGYVFNFHFLEELHDDPHINATRGGRAPSPDKVLVTGGDQVFNLHKDIFYIPNPTLSFVGIPFHIATFSLFEFQAYAVSRVYALQAKVPSESEMRREWQSRLERKGPGREFHALGSDLEQEYIKEILTWINHDGALSGRPKVLGHGERWFEVRDKALLVLKDVLLSSG
ncbi:FAD/NAD(P)-binding domain-containing protein [Basidiobolus meristosporus CBS 931.73]|uniref:FAD/NAD(P)-binding domain-containing protein n=1 Tax=Basidiobolus meristosporus CBS 931.73 TaxID=1314790 RepID=A0A1Y1XWI5_9FUNG|nr:FAD/NAD(P)-binding domain-containing protein [Basidiobolus meristosporus CBS 931.73]|eukprot:ORX90129.1 FAD/NAD(P)-binding domain-containing protein [Basidiobolus meristosporus CBS 931.73]